MILLDLLDLIAKGGAETNPRVTGARARTQRPTQGAYDRMVGQRRNETRKLIRRLKNGEVTVDELGDLFDAILLEGHTHAYVLGRQRAGQLEGETIDDVIQGIARKDPESQWLQNFMRDLAEEDPRYFDEESGLYKEAEIFNRANLYIGKMRGTAGEAFVENSPDFHKDGQTVTTFEWILGLNENHCDDCPRIARLSPFTKETLFAFPGSGDTACLGNCKCYLRRSDGIKGFTR